jgi:hypothetical protein
LIGCAGGRRYIMSVKVGGAPATNSLDFVYESPVIRSVVLTGKPCLTSSASDPAAVDADGSASQVLCATPVTVSCVRTPTCSLADGCSLQCVVLTRANGPRFFVRVGIQNAATVLSYMHRCLFSWGSSAGSFTGDPASVCTSVSVVHAARSARLCTGVHFRVGLARLCTPCADACGAKSYRRRPLPTPPTTVPGCRLPRPVPLRVRRPCCYTRATWVPACMGFRRSHGDHRPTVT